MQQICSRYAADMQQICSRYAADVAICSKYSNWQQFDKYWRREEEEEEDELLDFKKHSIFIDVLKKTTTIVFLKLVCILFEIRNGFQF